MLKKFKPRTPGTRQLLLPKNKKLTKRNPITNKRTKPQKNLLLVKTKTNGRNNMGHITCRHRGGGHKRKYRIVDFKRDKIDIPAKVASIEYDPNRTAYIALLHYVDGEKRYILAPNGLEVGDTVQTSAKPPYNVGCCMRMKDMPLGSVIHNIETVMGKGGSMVRSAGTSAQLMARSDGKATIRMPSSEMRTVSEECYATLGSVSKPEHSLTSYGKAGRMRWLGIRPTVRGTAMNPVDHPHGGGEGKNSGGIPKTPWGVPTKGKRTRSHKKSNKHLVQRRK